MRVEELNIADLIPHSGGSVLLDSIIFADNVSIKCALKVKENQRYVDAQGVETLVSLEWMAQAVAVFSGLEKRRQALESDRGDVKPRRGMLISCRQLDLHLPKINIDDELEIVARMDHRSGDIAAFSCQVFRGKDCLAEGILNVYEGELDDPEKN